jgi:formamidopyrimidine-DNA glycosylase
MPELPEVETMRRGILAIRGGRIAAVERLACQKRPIRLEPRTGAFRRRAVGQRIESIDRIGKRVVVRLSSEDAIVFEPRMTGLVLVSDAPTPDHLRFRLSLTGCPISDVWYWDRRGLGSVRLFSPAELANAFGPHRVGPDALAATPSILEQRLGNSRRPIKVALLDQRALAGIGNLYAAEILHLARVHPETPCSRLGRRQWTNIAAAISTVLEEAIHHEGSTLSDGTYRNALNTAGGYQNHHRVYDKAGQPCPTCRRAAVRRIVQAQRATFYCPRCQRLARGGAQAAD